MELTSEAIELLSENKELRFAICSKMDVEHSTIVRWIKENNIMLRTEDCMLLIEEYTKLTRSEILTKKQTV